MRLLHVVCCVLLLNSVFASWLSDVFTGLGEAAEDASIKKDLKSLESKVKYAGETLADKVMTYLPEDVKMDWVKATKDFLHNIQFKEILEERSNVTMAHLVERWNNILKELNNQEDLTSSEEMYKRINEDMKDLFPAKLYRKWKKKVHSLSKKFKKMIKNVNMNDLKESVKHWKQPSFMHIEDVEEEKKMVKDAVDAVNEKLKKGKKLINKVPLIKMSDSKKLTDEKEEEIEDWLKEKFQKPHHLSGHSKWEDIMSKLPLKKFEKKMEKKFKKLPLKKLTKKVMKLLKKNKNNQNLLDVKEPGKTDVTVLGGEQIPIVMSEEDSKKLELLSPKEREEYKKAESKWEKKVLEEAQKLFKNMKFAKFEAKTTTKPTTVKPIVNENWDLVDKEKKVIPWDEDEDSIDFDDQDDEHEYNVQSTKSKLNKSIFTDKLANEEVQWFDIKKKLLSKLKGIGA